MNHDEKHLQLIQLLPADGWRAYYYEEEEDTYFSTPLISWGLHACGCVIPLGVRDSLNVSDLKAWNAVGIFRDGEPSLDEMIQGAIDEWKDNAAKHQEVVRSTAN
ncbi:hypothetical protein LCGC14_0630770 [marine sediment metagenome]|uniref:Uncharacterized protein n=1 Tax=marine sediment metagenome TaxID=412755 RepID=A0A0F9R1Z4_9ZZZZ